MSFRDDVNFLLFVLAVMAFLCLVAFSCAAVSERMDYSSMQSLGYEAKYVNFSCFAKLNGRYLRCDAVAVNQIEVK